MARYTVASQLIATANVEYYLYRFEDGGLRIQAKAKDPALKPTTIEIDGREAVEKFVKAINEVTK